MRDARLSVCVVTVAVIATVSALALTEVTPGGAAEDDKLALVTSTPPPPPGQLRADLNCDDSIDPRDSLVLLRADAGLGLDVPADCLAPDVRVDWEFPFYYPILDRADLNCDESIDPRDSLVILRADAGILLLDIPWGCIPPDVEVGPA